MKDRKKRAAAELAEKLIRDGAMAECSRVADGYDSRKKKRDEMIEKALLAMSTVQGSYLEAEKNVPRSYVTESSKKCASDLFKNEFSPINCEEALSQEPHQSPKDSSLCYSKSKVSSPASIANIDSIPSTCVKPSFVYSRQYLDNRSRYWKEIPVNQEVSSSSSPKTKSANISALSSTVATMLGPAPAASKESSWWDSVQFYQKLGEPVETTNANVNTVDQDQLLQSTVLNESTQSLEDSRSEDNGLVRPAQFVSQSDKSVQVGQGFVTVSRVSVAVQTKDMQMKSSKKRKKKWQHRASASNSSVLVFMSYWSGVVKSTLRNIVDLLCDYDEQRGVLPATHNLNSF